MKFSNLIQNLEVISLQGGDPEIKGISCDSGQVRQGYLFVAIKGERDNGHRFIGEAVERGAVAIILEEELPLKHSLASARVKNSRLALAKLSACFYYQPSSKINLIGITGTDGKTTVSYLIKNILKSFNKRVGLLGTINYEIGSRAVPATNTTPDAVTLNSYLRDMLEENADYAVLEVSSHSVSQHRIDGLSFNSAIFTNFGQDHLNYHRTLEDYFQAKKGFLKGLSPESKLIVNADDPNYARIIKDIKAEIFTYAIKKGADVFIEQDSLALSLEGIKFKLRFQSPNSRLYSSNKDFFIQSPLIGEYNVYNILAAICFCLTEGIPLEVIASALKEFPGVPGRLQKIDCGQDFSVFVDYAHTAGALQAVLTNLKKYVNDGGKLITVFGCGGARDNQKRAQMGKISSEISDAVILTSDNPRSEDPARIIQDISQRIKRDNYEVILEREEAIAKGISLAKKGDIVLIAGKGHEKYQIFKDTVVPFDDVEVSQKCLLKKF